MTSNKKVRKLLICGGLMTLLAAALVGLYPVFRQRMQTIQAASAEENARQKQARQEAAAEEWGQQRPGTV